MARMTFRAAEEYELKLSSLSASAPEVIKAAIYAGARVMANAIKNALTSLPTDKFRYLRNGEKFSGPTASEKSDLIESFGITPIAKNRSGDWSAKIGFDGYGSTPTPKYPNGVPNQLVARSIDSGSTVRKKTSFVRKAVNRARAETQEAMATATDEAIKKIYES